ncbi:hypothetical protein AMATHDRAFT_76886 [Amanita thiersii Skay4041]|uniref:DUF726-domain-containing protein n=1 Tax=Amanita thiersii Skay4041 TaxID=703135 RepID=A0A2A9NFK7_9AGAR|nr:hypothetical protein AMATHDRAFT_76886 [Amanita thiersii Skay4041]
MPPTSVNAHNHSIFDDDDDDEGWQEMPVIREDEFASGLDEEDRKKYHYIPSAKGKTAANATGNLIDFDDSGQEWRSKLEVNESEYTRLRVNEEDDADEVHLRTKYLFDEDKAMTPLSQMQATKNLLTEAQRIAYVGLCALTSREMSESLKRSGRKELKAAATNMELWALKIMGRLYYHMELETAEQKMIESLAEHGVQAMDLVPALMTTHTVANPEYDPEEAKRQEMEEKTNQPDHPPEVDEKSISDMTLVDEPTSTTKSPNPETVSSSQKPFQTTAKVFTETSTAAMPGVTTSLSAADKDVTLDIRWTVLCDLFLVLIADSVYDARSRVLLEHVASKLGLGWLDVVKFESRVTEALEIQEDIENLDHKDLLQEHFKSAKKKRYMMLGLATLGGGLVIGLSAGLLAPVIGAGLGAALTTIGISGTTGFLAGAGGAAVITTGGVLTGSGIAVKGMAKRTQQVRTFDVLPLHNNKRVSCILTVPGFMNGIQDDVRLPFSVLDPVVGDVFSVLWEPEMIRETGSALKILTSEVLSQVSMTVLQATVMTALMSALQWPVILTKLGYLIDNPWNNALDRARRAGLVLADVLIQRHLGVRPITLIGFSLGARVIFYALLELAKQKAFGVVQDVFLLGATLTASTKTWYEARSVISGRLVNCYARNDWVLNYLFRATSGGVGTVAGLRPVNDIPGVENIDVTDKIAGHMSYRTFMPLILDQLGFPVFSDYFDEPEEPDFTEDRIVVREGDEQKKKGWFFRKKSEPQLQHVSRPPSVSNFKKSSSNTNTPVKEKGSEVDDDLPPRINGSSTTETSTESVRNSIDSSSSVPSSSGTATPTNGPSESRIPKHAGFDFGAIKQMLGDAQEEGSSELKGMQNASPLPIMPLPQQGNQPRQASSPHLAVDGDISLNGSAKAENVLRRKESDLDSRFTRSVSLKLNEDDEEGDLGGPSQSGSSNTNHSLRSASYESFMNTPRPLDPSTPTMSFGDRTGTFWDATSLTTPSAPLHVLTSSLTSASTSALTSISAHNQESTSKKPGLSPTSSSSNYATALSSPLSANPFTPPPPPPSYAEPLGSGLSFGGVDGSITVSSFGLTQNDPWSIPFGNGNSGNSLDDLGRKRTQMSPGFDSNPWS